MTDTPPRDDPQCDEVCDHDWRTYDGPWRPYEGATNVRTCANCVAVAWDSRMAPMPGEDEVVLESADGRRWIRTEHGWLEHRFDKPVPLTPELLDPAATLRAFSDHLTRQGQAFKAAYGTPSAYQRGMQIARDGSEPPVVGTAAVPDGASHVEVYTEDGWVRADALELSTRLAAMTIERDDLARELSKLQKRGNPDTWDRQATTIAQQAKEIGVLHDRIREHNSADARAEKAEATLARIKAMAGRWQYVPGKKDAAHALLAALGNDDTPEQP